MHQAIYFSRGGNTRMVAEAIAEAVAAEAANIENGTPKLAEGVLFFGSGCYGGKPSPKIMEFIESNEFQGRRTALFGTSGSGNGEELADMSEALNKKGATVVATFSCKGKTFGLVNRSRPNAEDLDRAGQFARDSVGAIRTRL